MPTQLKDFNPTFITRLTKFFTIIFPSTLIKVCLLNLILNDRFNSIISIFQKPNNFRKQAFSGWAPHFIRRSAASAISSYPKPFQHKSLICVGLFSCPPTFESKLSSLCCMKKASSDYRRRLCIEVPSGFEPLWELLQSSA